MPDTIDNNDTQDFPNRALPPPRTKMRVSRRAMGAGAVIAVLIAGAALGAGGTRMAQLYKPQSVMLLQPGAINQMNETSVVAIKGEVAEIYGNKFVLQDSSGRALVDTGPRGESRVVATKGEAVTVQGRFDRGIVRAEVIVHADGRNEAFGPPGPKDGPKGPKDGPKGPKGPKDKDGPRAERDAPLPPPLTEKRQFFTQARTVWPMPRLHYLKHRISKCPTTKPRPSPAKSRMFSATAS